jgi:hypothetical protein
VLFAAIFRWNENKEKSTDYSHSISLKSGTRTSRYNPMRNTHVPIGRIRSQWERASSAAVALHCCVRWKRMRIRHVCVMCFPVVRKEGTISSQCIHTQSTQIGSFDMSDNDGTSFDTTRIDDLPEEILLRIFRYILPYKYDKGNGSIPTSTCCSRDYSSIRLVCHQWARLARVISKWRRDTFHDGLSISTHAVPIHWQTVNPPARFNLIPRFAHSTCYVDSKRMLYVFGGSRDATTSLNDFWRLDLSTRK